LQVEKVSPVGVIDQVFSGLQAQANQKNITLTKDIPETGILDMDADSALLQQAVYNLVDNALKYTPVGGKVNIRLEQREGNVIFEVSDTGIGVAPLDLPRVFEKFYRSGRREAYNQRGSGLGLAIVKSIVERHGGKVWVESQLGKGSRFFILIPLERAAKPVSAGIE
jgi:two-component system, OmpR family, phosphate regulon sensor histidine kinase PhoR